MSSTCAYPSCQYDDSGHRPYARLRDGLPSASTVAGCLDAGDKARAFSWSAALIAATTAVHETDRWWNLPTHLDNGRPCAHQPWIDGEDGKESGLCRCCRFIRSEFDRVWRAKANLGSHIHHLALSWAKGENVETDPTTEPYMDALEKFYLEHQPDFHALERTVRYADELGRDYRGQFDFIAYLNYGYNTARTGLWDIKTGSFHPVEQTLQLAGYRYATWLTDWEYPEKGSSHEYHTGDMPVVDEAGILMLHDTGEYELIALPADRAAFKVFLGLREDWAWARGIEKWEKERQGNDPVRADQ